LLLSTLGLAPLDAGVGSQADGGTLLESEAGRPARTSIRASLEAIVARRMPEFLKDQASRRLSLARGLVGIGGYFPPGYVDGVDAPPLRLFPDPALGQSLNVDPTTGKSYFWP
jgi:hypothetical protein